MRSLQSREDLRYYLRADLCRYGGGVSRKAFRQTYRFVPGFRFTVWLRLTMFLAVQPVFTRPLYRLCMRHFRRLRIRYGFDIESGTQIGPGLHLSHWGGVVVHPAVVIGENCNLSQQITIGIDSKEGGAAPVLGDRVYVGPGSRVFGGVTVGSDSALGANCVVNRDVPAGVTVGGVPAKVISQDGSAGYVRNLYVIAD